MPDSKPVEVLCDDGAFKVDLLGPLLDWEPVLFTFILLAILNVVYGIQEKINKEFSMYFSLLPDQ
jgi:hypothetical protein